MRNHSREVGYAVHQKRGYLLIAHSSDEDLVIVTKDAKNGNLCGRHAVAGTTDVPVQRKFDGYVVVRGSRRDGSPSQDITGLIYVSQLETILVTRAWHAGPGMSSC